MARDLIDALFPQARREGYSIASPQTRQYNCVAWAAGDTKRWWWPTGKGQQLGGYYWPAGVPNEPTIDNFVQVFELQGYTVCSSGDLERGLEKIAIYGNADGPTHAARQLPSGRWASKLGPMHDIEHHTLHALEASAYGAVAVIMARRRIGKPPPLHGRLGGATPAAKRGSRRPKRP